MPPVKAVVHLLRHAQGALAQGRVKGYFLPPPCALVENGSRRHRAQKHLLQTDRLTAQLQRVRLRAYSPFAMFVFNGIGAPTPLFSLQGDSLRIPVELHHVTGPLQPEGVGYHPHPPGDEQATPALPPGFIVRGFVLNAPLRGQQVFRPLLFNMDQRPLPPAKGEVLNAGKGEVVVIPAVSGHACSHHQAACPAKSPDNQKTHEQAPP